MRIALFSGGNCLESIPCREFVPTVRKKTQEWQDNIDIRNHYTAIEYLKSKGITVKKD